MQCLWYLRLALSWSTDDAQITGIKNNGTIVNANPVRIRFLPIKELDDSKQSPIENTPNPQQDVLINNT